MVSTIKGKFNSEFAPSRESPDGFPEPTEMLRIWKYGDEEFQNQKNHRGGKVAGREIMEGGR